MYWISCIFKKLLARHLVNFTRSTGNTYGKHSTKQKQKGKEHDTRDDSNAKCSHTKNIISNQIFSTSFIIDYKTEKKKIFIELHQ